MHSVVDIEKIIIAKYHKTRKMCLPDTAISWFIQCAKYYKLSNGTQKGWSIYALLPLEFAVHRALHFIMVRVVCTATLSVLIRAGIWVSLAWTATNAPHVLRVLYSRLLLPDVEWIAANSISESVWENWYPAVVDGSMCRVLESTS